MPNYTFFNKLTEEEETLSMSMKDLDSFKIDNPHMSQMLRATPLADPTRVGITTKPDNEFRNLLKDMKGKHRGNIINTF